MHASFGLEGLVSKRRDRPYQPGRSKHWIKVKSLKFRLVFGMGTRCAVF
jgi:ATP-dependent DNA ligase